MSTPSLLFTLQMNRSWLRISTAQLMLLSTCLFFWVDAIAADGLVKAVPGADTQLVAKATAVDITRIPGREHEGYNVAFLYGVGQSADVKTLLMGNDVLPGIYRVDIYANNTLVGRQDVVFSENPKSGEVEACFSEVNRPGFSRHLASSLHNAFQTLPVTADC